MHWCQELNMENLFFEKPILNSPYEYPKRHWEIDAQGQLPGFAEFTEVYQIESDFKANGGKRI